MRHGKGVAMMFREPKPLSWFLMHFCSHPGWGYDAPKRLAFEGDLPVAVWLYMDNSNDRAYVQRHVWQYAPNSLETENRPDCLLIKRVGYDTAEADALIAKIRSHNNDQI